MRYSTFGLMNAPSIPLRLVKPGAGDSSLAARLRKEIEGEVMFDAASRGRYSTDASIYQVEPLGVVVPRTEEAARTALAIALEAGMPVLPRGAGTSQCGQAVGQALVIDHTKYLNKILEVNADAATAVVQPGVVLDALNAVLRAHQLWFPVDVSTSAQATIGGMAGNNSCGSRSIAYGNMVHNVLAMDMTRHIVPLAPSAVELVDRTMIGLARDIPAFRKTVDAVIKGDPEAILLVEFSGEDAAVQLSRLKQLTQLMGDLGLPGSVVEIADAPRQKALWEVRKAGLNIMMSMKGDGKPVSFIEDCAVPLEHLAEYTERL